MDKQTAIDTLQEYNRNSINPELAKEIANALGVTFIESLIYTKQRYRELSDGKPRVAVWELTRFICNIYNLEPDEKLFSIANSQHGEGSHIEYTTRAYLKPLAEHLGLNSGD